MAMEAFKTGIANAALADALIVTCDATATDQVKLPAAVTDFAFGITYGSTSAAGQSISIQTEGEARVQTSAAVTRGQQLKYGVDGKVLAATTAADKVIGVCLKTVGANEITRVYIARTNF